MRLEPGALAEERGIELSRDLALIPTLNQNDILLKVGPAHAGLPGKRVSGREYRHQRIAI